jgi:hypothetical protein
LSSTTSRSRSGRSRERGQVLVLFAGAIVALMIIAAAAFDIGMMLVERRDEQNAADAAALAGARYVLTDPVKAEAVARKIALINGFDDADPDEVVTVHIPAVSGRYAGFPGFIEVDIQGTRASIFGGIIGRSQWPVGVMAVATNRQDLTFPFSMMALNPTMCKAIQVAGSGLIQAFANIQSNSNGSGCGSPPISFSRTGGSTIDVIADDATCRAVGIIQDQGSGPPMSCDKVENSFALPDPLRNLPAPTKPPLAAAMVPIGHTKAPPDYCPGAAAPKIPSETQPAVCDVGGNGTSYRDLSWLLSPGLYPHGIAVTNGATAYLLPGIYWIGGGGLDVKGGASIFTVATATDATPLVANATWGGGVMFYNSKLPTIPGDAWTLEGSGATMKIKALHAPVGDPTEIYNDIVIFQDRTVTTGVTLNGSASQTEVEGMIYVPKGGVTLNGNGGTLIVDQIIADNFTINGGGGTLEVLARTGFDSIISAAGLVD